MSIELERKLPLVLHGTRGYSRKSPQPGNATHYYSAVGLTGRAVVRAAGRSESFEATGWLDREFGSNVLDPNQTGWDWFALSLSDGSHLMLVEVRSRSGVPYRFGTRLAASGRQESLRDFRVEAKAHWTSPHTGARYPVVRRLVGPGFDLVIRPWLNDQELGGSSLGIVYWEGAVDVAGHRAGKAVHGRGYLEMTGYAGAMDGKL